ncbi:hypothetical protein KOR34_46260 [Posidoniimonas corsicana]|uniref:Uncharacterized protein n=1 Tax=Posidoniimonas corsicana TaxID=1938618 RepID=A0A5C5V041_9BACT|nr:hypothetical protein [Posidoniimonas corsicana]TWT31250.1 hypothetical protein KOR34_46260 [Posidoniimonas corsicana]
MLQETSEQEDSQPTPMSFQFRVRTLFVVTLLVAIPLVGFVIWDRAMDRLFDGLIKGEPGYVTTQEDWPRPLSQLLESAQASDVELGEIRVYCVANGLSSEYAWRMEETEGLLELLVKDLSLSDHTPKAEERFRAQDHLPDWWDPEERANTRYYAANVGGVGEQFLVFHDPRNESIYVHYYDNW